jgi:hypothetical protein
MGHCVVGLALSQNIMGYMEWSLCERCPGEKSIPPSPRHRPGMGYCIARDIMVLLALRDPARRAAEWRQHANRRTSKKMKWVPAW